MSKMTTFTFFFFTFKTRQICYHSKIGNDMILVQWLNLPCGIKLFDFNLIVMIPHKPSPFGLNFVSWFL